MNTRQPRSEMLETMHHRRSIRLRDYDYSFPGTYFVTICTYRRANISGCIQDNQMALSHYGEIARQNWEELPDHFPSITCDVFAIMPNHVHGIIIINQNNTIPRVGAQHAVPLPGTQAFQRIMPLSLPAVIRAFKSATTKHVNGLQQTPGGHVWQRGYYEHVIRTEGDLNMVREYIINNPLQWTLDRENPEQTGVSPVERALFQTPSRVGAQHAVPQPRIR